MSVQKPQMWTSSGPRSFRTRSSSVSKNAEYRRFWITAAASGSNRRSSSTRSCSSVPTMQWGGNIRNSASFSTWLSLVKMTGVPAPSSSLTSRTTRGIAAVHSGLAMFPSRVNPSWTSVTIRTRPGMRTPLAGRSSTSIGARTDRLIGMPRLGTFPRTHRSRRHGAAGWRHRRICMDRRHTGWVRPALVLGVLGVVAAALIISPASAHFVPAHEKKHVRTIARRIARKEARIIVQTSVGPTLFIEETELVRFGPVKMATGAPDQTLGTFGPFTVKASCDDEGGGVEEAQAFIETSVAGSLFDSYWWGTEAPFDPSETNAPIIWTEAEAAGLSSGYLGIGHAEAPNGTSLSGDVTAFTNLGTSACTFSGYFLHVASV